MSPAPALARRAITALRQAATPSGVLPRHAYLHCFIEEEGIHSSLLVHNFYSLFAPDVSTTALVRLQMHDHNGTRIGALERDLAPFGSLHLPVAEILAAVGGPQDGYGTVTVDIEASEAGQRALAGVAPQGGIVKSPFWMEYFDATGSVAYVHSIDQRHGSAQGVNPMAGLLYRSPASSGGRWQSRRLVTVDGLEQLDAYLVNHGSRRQSATIRCIAHPDGTLVGALSASVAPLGVARLRIKESDLKSVVGLGSTHLRLEAHDLCTPNGKAYILTRYRDGPFAFHHG